MGSSLEDPWIHLYSQQCVRLLSGVLQILKEEGAPTRVQHSARKQRMEKKCETAAEIQVNEDPFDNVLHGNDLSSAATCPPTPYSLDAADQQRSMEEHLEEVIHDNVSFLEEGMKSLTKQENGWIRNSTQHYRGVLESLFHLTKFVEHDDDPVSMMRSRSRWSSTRLCISKSSLFEHIDLNLLRLLNSLGIPFRKKKDVHALSPAATVFSVAMVASMSSKHMQLLLDDTSLPKELISPPPTTNRIRPSTDRQPSAGNGGNSDHLSFISVGLRQSILNYPGPLSPWLHKIISEVQQVEQFKQTNRHNVSPFSSRGDVESQRQNIATPSSFPSSRCVTSRSTVRTPLLSISRYARRHQILTQKVLNEEGGTLVENPVVVEDVYNNNMEQVACSGTNIRLSLQDPIYELIHVVPIVGKCQKLLRNILPGGIQQSTLDAKNNKAKELVLPPRSVVSELNVHSSRKSSSLSEIVKRQKFPTPTYEALIMPRKQTPQRFQSESRRVAVEHVTKLAEQRSQWRKR